MASCLFVLSMQVELQLTANMYMKSFDCLYTFRSPFVLYKMASSNMISIQRQTTISVPGQRPWVVETQTVDGVELVTMEKRDRGFNVFVTGKREGLIKNMWLETLKRMRCEATTQAMNSVGQATLFEDKPAAAPTKRLKKKVKQDMDVRKDAGSGPQIVELQMPEFKHEGIVYPAQALKVLAETSMRVGLQVELTVEGLAYIRAAILLAEDPRGQRSTGGNYPGWAASRK